LTQQKPSRTVAYSGVSPICGGSVKIGSSGQTRIGANKLWHDGKIRGEIIEHLSLTSFQILPVFRFNSAPSIFMRGHLLAIKWAKRATH